MNQKTTWPACAEYVKLLGRTCFSDSKLFCALSGSGVEFSFTGTACTISVEGDDNSNNPDMKNNHARIAICVNGERIIDDMINESLKTYTVFESDTAEHVTITVIKLTEAPMSTIAILPITITGSCPKPTAANSRFIEFVGDSITCGYGVDDPYAEHNFSTVTEDVTKAYAYKTAKALDADYSMVSFSGYGIISGFTSNNEKVTNQLVPPLYDRLGYSWSYNPGFTPSDIKWDFSIRRPDAIVINLGTNDNSYTQDNEERRLEYSRQYTAFLEQIRSLNPGSKIICTLGMMGDTLFPWIEQAVQKYKDKSNDANIFTLRFEVQTDADGYSADWHPSIKTHDKAAARLISFLQTLL